MRNVYRVCRDIALFPKNLSKVKRIVDGHTYFPEKRRKPKSIRLKENLAYLLKIMKLIYIIIVMDWI